MTHLPLSQQFETIQNQARLKAVAEDSETLRKTVALSDITLCDITLEIYPSLQDIENKKIKTNSPKPRC